MVHVVDEKSVPAFNINILMSYSIPDLVVTPFLELIPRSKAGPKILYNTVQ